MLDELNSRIAELERRNKRGRLAFIMLTFAWGLFRHCNFAGMPF